MTKIKSGITRRDVLRVGLASLAFPGTAILNLAYEPGPGKGADSTEGSSPYQPNMPAQRNDKGKTMKIQYLEIVTPDVDASCALYSQMFGVAFGQADLNLGGARTAPLAGGGMLGIRAPLRNTETPVVRPYWLVDDINASVAAAAEAGAEIAMSPTEIPGYGRFAIVIQGGIESGLWQL